MSDPQSRRATRSDETRRADVVVIGLGSAGEQFATRLAEAGHDVVGFEPGLVGGECPYLACIPSKSMLHDMHTDRSWQEAVARRDELASHRDDQQHADDLVEAGVELRRETAQLSGERTVTGEHGVVKADHVVIATGAGAVLPDIDGIDHERVWTSADALRSTERPDRLLVLGGGAIGCELSQVYASFGTEVVLVDHGDHLLSDADPEVSSHLAARLRDDGVNVRLGVTVERIEPSDTDALVTLGDGTSITVDRILVAAGVEPRLGGLGLDSVGLDPDALEIDDDGSIDGIGWLWAIGDVTPTSSWTHGANRQAKALADRLDGRAWPPTRPIFPHCVFTSPPVGMVGANAAAARADGHDVVVGRATYGDIARGATDEADQGEVAVVVDRPSGRILGASVVGPRADDVIQIVTAFMIGDVDIDRAARTVFPFPTYNQVLEVALEAARNR